MNALKLACLALATLLVTPSAQAQNGDDRPPLRVGTKVSEPFVIKNENDGFTGLSIRLWEQIAQRQSLDFEFVELELDEILDGVASGELDAGIAAISVTPAREEHIDFTNTYFMSGLAIAVTKQPFTTGFLKGLLGVFTPGFWIAVGSLALLLLAVGVLAWLAERRRNTEQFNASPIRGIGDGFWFSAVTMTTVGYGDKAPVSTPGRVLALVWMFASIIVISTFTGTIASSITASSLRSGVQGVDDLADARVGIIGGTQADDALDSRGIGRRTFTTLDEGLSALANEEIDAFVHDSPIVRYTIKQRFADQLRVLDAQFDYRPYAIALPPESQLREPINRSLLEVTETPAWRDAIKRYLGSD